ncbi:hypothetical protein CR159_09630 [Pollutimonas subterranea]|uniref:Uncharacterized protein n=1 Tax=Pollutimonas subterranea TaxID=2045210 RepID=A0A2N4U5E9_9BURK|nr:hypothetical protein CR159_09630 [Pollutimonas subterranea]
MRPDGVASHYSSCGFINAIDAASGSGFTATSGTYTAQRCRDIASCPLSNDTQREFDTPAFF